MTKFDGVTPAIAQSRLVSMDLVQAANIPPPKLDETINLATPRCQRGAVISSLAGRAHCLTNCNL